jgi:tetratricopeptide (TPR) repeat protein
MQNQIEAYANKKSEGIMTKAAKLYGWTIVAIAYVLSIKAGMSQTVGSTNFENSCGEDVSAEFNGAVAILHSMWHEEAASRFERVTETNPGCAIAYWGIAMANAQIAWGGPPTNASYVAGRAAIVSAQEIEDVLPVESDFIDAAAEIYIEGNETWNVRHEDAMAALYERFPDNTEVALFYVLAILANPDADVTLGKQERAGAIAERVFAEEPNHPGAAHYVIHSYDYPSLANDALEAATQYGDIAPDVAHALHMPTHIFSSLGMWDETMEMNVRSADSARRASNAQQETHSLSYLVYAHLQKGEDAEAAEVLHTIREVADANGQNAGVVVHLADPLSRFVLQRHAWDERTRLEGPDYLLSIPEAAALVFPARAIVAARSGDTDAARLDLERLDEVMNAAEGTRTLGLYRPERISIWKTVAAAWIALAEDRQEEAVRLMDSAVELGTQSSYLGSRAPGPDSFLKVWEQRGDLMMILGRYSAAREAYERSSAVSPNHFNSIYGTARSAELLGDDEAARAGYEILLALASPDSSRPEVEQARTALGEL